MYKLVTPCGVYEGRTLSELIEGMPKHMFGISVYKLERDFRESVSRVVVL